jgi:hypothetical protein
LKTEKAKISSYNTYYKKQARDFMRYIPHKIPRLFFIYTYSNLALR